MNEDFIEVKQKLIDMYNFNESIQVELTPCGVKPILDYIDSKDKEINKLTAESTEWESKFYDLQKENERLKQRIELKNTFNNFVNNKYKSRCEKAKKKVVRIIDYGYDYDGFNNVKDLKKLIDGFVKYAEETINILNGDDK